MKLIKNQTLYDRSEKRLNKSYATFLKKVNRMQSAVYNKAYTNLYGKKGLKAGGIKNAIQKTIDENKQEIIDFCLNDLKKSRAYIVKYIKKARFIPEDQKTQYLKRYDQALKNNFSAFLNSTKDSKSLDIMKDDAARILYQSKAPDSELLDLVYSTRKDINPFNHNIVQSYSDCTNCLLTEFQFIMDDYAKGKVNGR